MGKPTMTLNNRQAEANAEADIIELGRVKTVYRKYMTMYIGTKFETRYKQNMFTQVHALRTNSNKVWGVYFHYFFDKDGNANGPYPDEETAYATWLLYMSTIHGH